MIKAFIKIRIKQTYRTIIGIGLFRIFILLLIVGLLMTGMLIYLSDKPGNYIVSSVYLVVLVLIHTRREDKKFIKIHFNNYRFIYLAEYLFLSIPLLIGLSYFGHILILLVFALSISFIVNIDINTKQRSWNTKIQRLIPEKCFEWKSGIRKKLFLILMVWFLGMGASYFVGSVPIVIFILGLILLTFYEKGESIQMLLAFEKGTRQFLLHKIKNHLFLFSIIIIPLISAFLIFHFDKWYIPVVEYFIFMSLHIYVILMKYAFYEPNKKSGAIQIYSSIGALGIFFPIFIPIVWMLTIWFYFRASENLTFYLNDYN